MKLEILDEDNTVIVIRKPAGIAVQSGRLSEEDCVSILKNYLSNGKGEPYIGVIHRLDQPVEGILAFAKTKAAAAYLSRQNKDFSMGKRYLAEVCGVPEKQDGTLSDWLVRDARTNTSRVVPSGNADAKRAELDYRVVQKYERSALLEIHLKTGRHHQIRVQLSNFGHPLIGDRKYGAAERGSSGALKLCAYKLTFLHPADGRERGYQIKPSWLSS